MIQLIEILECLLVQSFLNILKITLNPVIGELPILENDFQLSQLSDHSIKLIQSLKLPSFELDGVGLTGNQSIDYLIYRWATNRKWKKR